MNKALLLLTAETSIQLLQQSLQHYSECNFDQILLCILKDSNRDEKFTSEVERIAEKYGALVVDKNISTSTSFIDRRQRIIDDYCQKDDWLFMADIDELHQYSAPPAELIKLCVENNIDYISGNILDRIGADGNFPKFNAASLWDSFPVAVKLTENILSGQTPRVIASRCGVDNFESNPGRKLIGVIVHQFKWDSSVIERSRYKVWFRSINSDPAFLPPLRFLRFLDGKENLDLNTPELETFYPGYKRENSMDAESLTMNPGDPVFIIPERKKGVQLHKNDDIHFLFDPEQKVTIRITEQGLAAWKCFNRGLRVGEIGREMTNGFDAGSRIEVGLQLFVNKLMELKVINNIQQKPSSAD